MITKSALINGLHWQIYVLVIGMSYNEKRYMIRLGGSYDLIKHTA